MANLGPGSHHELFLTYQTVHEFIISKPLLYDVAECQLTDFNVFTRDVEVLAEHLPEFGSGLCHQAGPRSIPFLKIPIVITTIPYLLS